MGGGDGRSGRIGGCNVARIGVNHNVRGIRTCLVPCVIVCPIISTLDSVHIIYHIVY